MNPQEEIQQLEGLIDQLLSALQEILASGEILSDEFQAMLAQELELTVNRIAQLQSANPVEGLPPPNNPPPQDQIQQGMPSSNVEGFAYDDNTGRLLVRFLGQHPNRNGPIYAYSGVPREIFDLFQSGAVPARTDGHNRWGRWWRGKVPSLGASLFTLIKNRGYQYQRLT